jgi:hypothetical protein
MSTVKNSQIVAKASDIIFTVAWILILIGALGIFTGVADTDLVFWRIYMGTAGVVSGALALVLYVILKALEPITKASEAYLNKLEREQE